MKTFVLRNDNILKALYKLIIYKLISTYKNMKSVIFNFSHKHFSSVLSKSRWNTRGNVEYDEQIHMIIHVQHYQYL